MTSLGLTGNLQDALLGGGINSFDLTVVMGNLNIASPAALAIDAASANTNGSYNRVAYGISRLQRISNSTVISAQAIAAANPTHFPHPRPLPATGEGAQHFARLFNG